MWISQRTPKLATTPLTNKENCTTWSLTTEPHNNPAHPITNSHIPTTQRLRRMTPTMGDLLSYISKMLCIKARSEATQAGGCSPVEECRVCLSRIRVGEATRRLPCRHIFHRDCVDRWLLSCKRTCPLCRVYVADDNRHPVAKHTGRDALADDLVVWFSTVLVPGFWCQIFLLLVYSLEAVFFPPLLHILQRTCVYLS